MKRLWWWTIRHIYFLNVTTTEQNSCFWAMENPRSLHQHLLFAIHYDVYQRGIIGPYCFEKDATVTSPTYSLGYMSMTETFFIMQLRRRIININAWFQQDTRLMLEWSLLQDCSLISFPFGEVPRPPRSPELGKCGGISRYTCTNLSFGPSMNLRIPSVNKSQESTRTC